VIKKLGKVARKDEKGINPFKDEMRFVLKTQVIVRGKSVKAVSVLAKEAGGPGKS